MHGKWQYKYPEDNRIEIELYSGGKVVPAATPRLPSKAEE